jgi:hypothetical protein
MIFVIEPFMDTNIFKALRDHTGSHKKAAELIGLSYTRYNEWRWQPDRIPEYGKKLLELTFSRINSEHKTAPAPKVDAV